MFSYRHCLGGVSVCVLAWSGIRHDSLHNTSDKRWKQCSCTQGLDSWWRPTQGLLLITFILVVLCFNILVLKYLLFVKVLYLYCNPTTTVFETNIQVEFNLSLLQGWQLLESLQRYLLIVFLQNEYDSFSSKRISRWHSVGVSIAGIHFFPAIVFPGVHEDFGVNERCC